MISWWRRKRKEQGGKDAKREAQDNLMEALEQWPDVHSVAGGLRDLRERNHFAEALRASMGGTS